MKMIIEEIVVKTNGIPACPNCQKSIGLIPEKMARFAVGYAGMIPYRQRSGDAMTEQCVCSYATRKCNPDCKAWVNDNLRMISFTAEFTLKTLERIEKKMGGDTHGNDCGRLTPK